VGRKAYNIREIPLTRQSFLERKFIHLGSHVSQEEEEREKERRRAKCDYVLGECFSPDETT